MKQVEQQETQYIETQMYCLLRKNLQDENVSLSNDQTQADIEVGLPDSTNVQHVGEGNITAGMANCAPIF